MKTRVAVVGAGFMGRTHATSYGKGGLEAQVAYIVDSDLSRAQTLAGTVGAKGVSDVQIVLDDPNVDAVDICLPTSFHRELCLRAFQAGKHVLCEKPIAPSVQDADELVQAGKSRGKVFMIAQVMRFWPEYVEAAKLVSEGQIGALRHVACYRLSNPPAWSAGNWMLDTSQSGGAVRDLAIHDLDFMNHVAGGMPTKVVAVGDAMEFSASFRFKGGVTGSLEASYKMPPGFAFRMGFRLLGETGAVEFDGLGGSLTVVRDGRSEQVKVKGSRTFKQNESGEELDGYFHEIAAFVDSIRSGKPLAAGTPQQGRDALAMTFMVQEALQ